MIRRLCIATLLFSGCNGDKDEPGTDDTSAPTETTDDTTEPGDCAVGCQATMAAACPNGPASQEVCEQDCQDLLAGPCQSEYGALLACGASSSVSCDPKLGFPLVDDCPDEQGAFFACLNG